ncbi:hypothetical protein KUTeg_000817 [Tegillarca granosa]|uniref:C-type lectin domain-containing protein n=1 Tax=Tegillarca granosa TaxID=220873 RepID=A0ABQ9G1S1_TEGGR|nr:hypothetical protein KUTeg_000817 [Tegillarca granosa]
MIIFWIIDRSQTGINIPVQPVQPTTGCGSGWVEYSGMCYIIIKQRMTWNSALSHCHSLSGTLAEGYSHSVNDFLRNMMLSDHSACEVANFVYYFIVCSSATQLYSKYCWLGGQKSGGHWRWLTSGSFHYTDWNTHEPDNKYGNENCLEMGYHVDNHWNDQSCSDTRNFICQKRKP